MFAICIEASYTKGMGHLFRMLNFVEFLKFEKQEFIFLINNNEKVIEIIELSNYKYEIVDLDDMSTNWETTLIKKWNIMYWLNDRLNTSKHHAKNIIGNNIKLISFDDLGEGSSYCDINICGLLFNDINLKGKKILKGIDYLILNPEIDNYKRERVELKNVLLSLGGSDTYGVTVKVLKLLKRNTIKATIHIGPSFNHKKELLHELTDDYKILNSVPSLIKEFVNYDLAITGGGITPFEANATGLPCLIIANEIWEINNAEFLQSLDTSVFLGYYKDLNEESFSDIKKYDINMMSKNGVLKLNTNASKKIYKEIIEL